MKDVLLSDHFTIYTHCTPLIYTVLYFSCILKLEEKNSSFEKKYSMWKLGQSPEFLRILDDFSKYKNAKTTCNQLD